MSNTVSVPERPGWIQDAAVILIICLVGGWALFFHLGKGSLHDWDEAIYAQVSKEMVHSGDWLTEHYEYKPWFEKPPLFIWFTAILYRLFGTTELWARAASAMFGVALLVLTYALGKAVYGTWVGLAAIPMMVTSVLFMRYARRGMIETTLIFFLLLAIYGYLRLQTGGPRWWYLIWTSIALAFMAKSLAASVGPVTLGLDMVLQGRTRSVLRSKHFWFGFLVALLIIAPWHLLMYMRNGRAFLQAYLFFNASRLTTALEGNTGGSAFYVQTIRNGMFPWFYLAPFALALSVRENLRGNARSRVLLLFIAVVFVMCTAARTKILWYILPICPLLAIIIASMLVDAWRSGRSFASAGLLMGAFAAALFSSEHALVAVGISVVLLVVVFLCIYREQLHWTRGTAVFTCSAFLLVAGMHNVRALYYEAESSVARLGRIARASGASDRDPLILYGIAGPAALFYADRPVTVVHDREVLAEVLPESESQHIILDEADIPSLRPEYNIDVAAESGGFAYGTIVHSCDHCPASIAR
jgi:4-amino-4-deoxy-L-arabinose transferase-like glycosyltransferase